MPNRTRGGAGLWTVLGCGLTGGVLASALWLSPHNSSRLFLGTCAVFAVAVLLVVPVHVLPLVCLLVIFAVSDRITDFTLFPVLTPATAVLLLWLGRRWWGAAKGHRVAALPRSRTKQAPIAISVLLVVWLCVLLVVSPTRLGLSWTVTYATAVVATQLVPDTTEETRLLRGVLPWAGAVAAGYALLQTTFEQNWVFTPVLRLLGRTTVEQHWAVYRSDGSFGHPLVAGLFFAVVLAFCIGRWLETGRLVFGLLAVANGLGIICTVSRGSYVAAGVGVAGVIVLALFFPHRFGRARHLLMLTGCAVFAYLAVNTSSFLDRGMSQEAQASTAVREGLPYITIATARQYHWLGSGPATSLTAAAPFNSQGLRIENSYLQLLISVGLPGLACFVAALAALVLIALRLRNFGAAAGLIALAVGLFGFAAIDGLRNVLVLLGLLAMMALHREEAVPPTTRRAPVHKREPAPPIPLETVLGSRLPQPVHSSRA